MLLYKSELTSLESDVGGIDVQTKLHTNFFERVASTRLAGKALRGLASHDFWFLTFL